MTWLLGLDLGQSQDASALAIVEHTVEGGLATDDVRQVERWVGVPYLEQVARVRRWLGAALLAGATLIIDRTGVGRAVYDMFEAAGLQPIGVTVHGGDTASHEGRAWRVPKRDLVFAAVAQLQQRHLRIAAAVEHAETLTAELRNYRVTIDPATAHDSYSAWREGQHDDVVFAVALAVWYGQAVPPMPIHGAVGATRVAPVELGPWARGVR
jgi:hypothetical protein